MLVTKLFCCARQAVAPNGAGASSERGGAAPAAVGWPAALRNPRAQRRRSLLFNEDGAEDGEFDDPLPALPRLASTPRSHARPSNAAQAHAQGYAQRPAARPSTAESAPCARPATRPAQDPERGVKVEAPMRQASVKQELRIAPARTGLESVAGLGSGTGASAGSLPALMAAFGGGGGGGRPQAAALAAAAASAAASGTPPVARRLSQASSGAVQYPVPRQGIPMRYLWSGCAMFHR